jgi:hypothetical protein
MQYFLLGLAALVLVLLAIQGFTKANPQVMARQLRRAFGVAAIAVAAVLLVRGMAGSALLLAILGASLLGWRALGSLGGFGGQSKSPGQTSRVTTDHLEVALDHDTGAISGRVLRGLFAGRNITSLSPHDLALLWQDCRFSDPQSAQIIEAYLDREHPAWREDMAKGEREMTGADGRISEEEAYEILGLAPGASEDDIRRAHRELMMKLHPDRGGSTYLAAKINAAKDVLLGKLA